MPNGAARIPTLSTSSWHCKTLQLSKSQRYSSGVFDWKPVLNQQKNHLFRPSSLCLGGLLRFALQPHLEKLFPLGPDRRPEHHSLLPLQLRVSWCTFSFELGIDLLKVTTCDLTPNSKRLAYLPANFRNTHTQLHCSTHSLLPACFVSLCSAWCCRDFDRISRANARILASKFLIFFWNIDTWQVPGTRNISTLKWLFGETKNNHFS